MKKTVKAPSGKSAAKGSSVPIERVRDPETGEFLTIKGAGALKDSPLKFKKGVDLLKPIAEQVLGKRSQKRKTG